MAPVLTRRGFVAGGLCTCALHGGAAHAERIHPSQMQALAEPGFRPTDTDEKGMWQSVARLEEEVASSNLLMKSGDIQRYTSHVVGTLMGDRAKEARVYVVHDAAFNASMFPNGMMIVNSGLLVRMRDEAQFAAVLGHECGHYLRRHSVQRWRDVRAKSAAMAFVSAGTGIIAGVSLRTGGDARSWVDLANSINASLTLSIFRFSRENELEADAYGVKLMDAANYPPDAAAQIWRQIMDERRASAAVRNKKYRDASRYAQSTHPPTEARLTDLSASARELKEVVVTGRRYDARRNAWRAAIAPLRSGLLDEQVKLNDPGASLYLINSLAADGWDATLRFYEGEAYRLRDAPGDAEKAALAYATAVAQPDCPAEAWRANGYALMKAGRAPEGRQALARYLELSPSASDAAMVRFAINQQETR